MTQLTVMRKASLREVVPTPTRPLRHRPRGRGAGRTSAPTLRPSQVCRPPSARSSTVSSVRSCVVPAPVPAGAPSGGSVTSWRLTERGVGVVLVIGLMIMVAALTVVALTAVTVTGEGYRPSVSAILPA